MNISNRSFGTAPNGTAATLWTIENSSGLSVSLSNWGATLVSVMQPDRNGKADDVVLGFEDASGYVKSRGYLGATCGRFANRIAEGRFSLDGKSFELACNDGSNHLHGGDEGFNVKIWDAAPYSEGDRTGVVFSYLSPDGEENYPGELKIRADYALDESGRLYMEFQAETDSPTIINITNHAYWNLSGAGSGTILEHMLRLNSSHYLPVDATSIPTGELMDVTEGPFDFRKEKSIGRDINEVPGGFDHCMVVDGKPGDIRLAAKARDPQSGRILKLYTDRPGVQFYTGNKLSGEFFPRNGGFCLEPQGFPDAPNRPGFPSAVLRPGQTYHHRSAVEFSAE